MNEVGGNSLDPQLWHACAGGMVQMPQLNSNVFYFPQGHAEHTRPGVDFGVLGRIPAMILCKVVGIKFLADPETDEVYARISLAPVGSSKGCDLSDVNDGVGNNGSELAEKSSSFAKTLTQSDANNGGGFSVPRYCAETIFPRLDYTADPPVQTLITKDVHGQTWKFRHIYRGTPRRHLLTTGWSTFVNQKKLVAGDSIVFFRADNGDLCVGIRRAKRGGLRGPDSPPGWSTSSGNYGGFPMFLKEDENSSMRTDSSGNLNALGGNLRGRGRGRPEAVIDAASLAANGKPFEVVYYPRAGTPEFCVKASSVIASMRVQWCSGMRFKMPFETEDSSRISWFMGMVASVQVSDPISWPNSPWRVLQVTWDEPELLQTVKCVSPWLVELVSNMPVINLSPFSPPQKKLHLSQQSDISIDGQFPLPSFSGNPIGLSSHLCCLPDNITARIQGARHSHFGVPLLDLHSTNKLQLEHLAPNSPQLDSYAKMSDGIVRGHADGNDSISCLLSIGTSSQKFEKSENVKRPMFLLFGQPILTEQQISHGYSGGAASQLLNENPSSARLPQKVENFGLHSQGLQEGLSISEFPRDQTNHAAELALEADHGKVFLGSEDVGHTLDLSALGSYEDLYKRLANMFGLERSDLLSNVLYRDATGAFKHTGDEPFSKFAKTVKTLTIRMNTGNCSSRRKLITGLPTAECRLGSSAQTGSFSIFA